MKLFDARKVSALTAVAALALTGLLPATGFAEEDEFPTRACDEFLTPAPILASDLTDDSAPILPTPSADGHVTPIVVVHGWTSHGRHDEERTSNFSTYVDRQANGRSGELFAKDEIKSSFIGKLQQIPGAAVYMFDYGQVSSRWVTDEQIGTKLAKGIECLAQNYDNQAVVVGHSMGGLALREALSQPSADGTLVADKVSRAVTFGTPNDGTAIMDYAFKAVDGAMLVPGVNVPVGIVKLVLSECSKRADATGEFCFGVGGPVDAAYSEGAMAMLPGSPQITRLAKWPESVDYVALAGHINLGGFTLFGHSSKRLIDLGDMAVNYSSAISGGKEIATAECEYGIVSKASADDFGLRIASVFTGDAKRRPAGLLTPFEKGRQMASPCYHNNLMSEIGLVNKALSVIGETAATARPLGEATAVVAPADEGTSTPPAAPESEVAPAPEAAPENEGAATESGIATPDQPAPQVDPGN
ncbi:MAG: hypothetical protein Q4P06_08975 [Actinomycetaceae bacterium]|nr:hypothetical protein [Actinomycetaceae bacterium]